MTKKQRSLYKLGNAIRALHGSARSFVFPQKMAKWRILRWLSRCEKWLGPADVYQIRALAKRVR